MKLLKKISAVSLIILTAALIASCNSSPNAEKRGIATARATISENTSLTNETLTFKIDDPVENFQRSTMNIRIGENETPVVNIVIDKGEDKGIELTWNGLDEAYVILDKTSFDLFINLTGNSATFKIDDKTIGESEVELPCEIFIEVLKGSGWNNLDSITIEEGTSTVLDWEITN